MRTIAMVCALLSVGWAAHADTVYMKNGTPITGKIVFETGDRVEMRIGSRTVVLRASEIRSTEKNDKTGELDSVAIREKARKRLQQIEAETGLRVEDIREIKRLITLLQSPDPLVREDTFRAFVELQKRADVVGYLQGQLSRYTASFAVPVMEAIFNLNPEAGIASAREHAEVLSPAIRGKALSVLSRSEDSQDLSYVVRGLVDPDSRVRIIAAKAMMERREKRATPPLLENLKESNPYLRAAARDALQVLWEVGPDQVKSMSVESWETLWNERQNEVGRAYQVSQLTPLVDLHAQFVEE